MYANNSYKVALIDRGQNPRSDLRFFLGPPAPIFKRSQKNFTSTIGTKAKLLCRVGRVDASSTYWWTRNGIRIKDPIKYRVRPFRFLEIRKVKKADAGEYTCWAKNEGGQIQRIINFVVKGRNF